MNRTKAKTWAEIPLEKLELIMPNLAKHYDFLKAYAEGYGIQYRMVGVDIFGKVIWIDDNNPDFDYDTRYRIKPDTNGDDPWVPRCGDIYYFIDESGNVVKSRSENDYLDKKRIELKNYFRTKGEANFASEKIREMFLELYKES